MGTLNNSTIKRRNFIINKKFQFRFSFFVVSWLLALSLVFPFSIYSLFEFFLGILKVQESGAPYEIIKGTQTQVMFLLAAFELVFAVLVFLMSIFISHRIAGPIYRARKFLEEIKTGNFTKRVNFRKADYFKELADDLNSFCLAMDEKKKQDVELIEKSILPKLEALYTKAEGLDKKNIEEAVTAVKELRERYTD